MSDGDDLWARGDGVDLDSVSLGHPHFPPCNTHAPTPSTLAPFSTAITRRHRNTTPKMDTAVPSATSTAPQVARPIAGGGRPGTNTPSGRLSRSCGKSPGGRFQRECSNPNACKKGKKKKKKKKKKKNTQRTINCVRGNKEAAHLTWGPQLDTNNPTAADSPSRGQRIHFFFELKYPSVLKSTHGPYV